LTKIETMSYKEGVGEIPYEKLGKIPYRQILTVVVYYSQGKRP